MGGKSRGFKPVRVKKLLLLQKLDKNSDTQAAFSYMGIGFFGGIKRPKRDTDISFHCSAQVKN